jgi:hypothetical protein
MVLPPSSVVRHVVMQPQAPSDITGSVTAILPLEFQAAARSTVGNRVQVPGLEPVLKLALPVMNRARLAVCPSDPRCIRREVDPAAGRSDRTISTHRDNARMTIALDRSHW